MERKKRVEYLISTLCVAITSFLIYDLLGTTFPTNKPILYPLFRILHTSLSKKLKGRRHQFIFVPD